MSVSANSLIFLVECAACLCRTDLDGQTTVEDFMSNTGLLVVQDVTDLYNRYLTDDATGSLGFGQATRKYAVLTVPGWNRALIVEATKRVGRGQVSISSGLSHAWLLLRMCIANYLWV